MSSNQSLTSSCSHGLTSSNTAATSGPPHPNVRQITTEITTLLTTLNKKNTNSKTRKTEQDVKTYSTELTEFLSLIKKVADDGKKRICVIPKDKLYSNLYSAYTKDEYSKLQSRMPFSKYYLNSYDSYIKNYESDLKLKYKNAFYNVDDQEIHPEYEELRFFNNSCKLIRTILDNNSGMKLYPLLINHTNHYLPSFMSSTESIGFVLTW